MDLVDALTRVLDLARQAARGDTPVRSRQETDADYEACDLVEDYIVNEFGDD
jgi:hypothetical protein